MNRKDKATFVNITIVTIFAMAIFATIATKSSVGSAAELDPSIAQSIHSELGSKTSKKPVVVFMTTWCPACQAAEKFLKQNNIEYVKADVEKDRTAYKNFQKITGGKGSGVPVILIGREVMIGYDPQAILNALSESSSKQVY